MQQPDQQHEWNEYCSRAIARVTPALARLGYALDNEQTQISGERFLTRPIAGGKKLVLFGRRSSDGLRAVIKISDDALGIAELEHERTCRDVLHKVAFAYRTFHLPHELLFKKTDGFAISITEYIQQEKPFLERDLAQQFAFALDAFKTQEGAHATTYAHHALVARTFGEMDAGRYLEHIQTYARDVAALIPTADAAYAKFDRTSHDAIALLHAHTETIDRYGDFLTHWDFTPQNFRIRDGVLYLLDHSSLRFGNKYESWARFINFMVLYNPPLARALVEYVRLNRTPEETLALKLMCVYRLVELVRYYTTWIPRTDGVLQELARVRIGFWNEVLRATLDDAEVPDRIIETYARTRDSLRSTEEKRRQVGLH